MARKTRTDKQRSQASREADRLATEARKLDLRFQARAHDPETEQAIAEAEAFDSRDFYTGQPVPRRVSLTSPLEALKKESEERDAIADKMADRVKHAGAHVRTQALSNVAWAEREAQEARERFWEADGLARDYSGGLTPCADPDCTAELPRSAAYDTFCLCPAHYRIRIGVCRA